MLQPDVESVRPLPGHMLELRFATGEVKVFDVKPYLGFKYYQRLLDEAYFRTVRVQADKWGVVWAEGHDIAPHELYEDSVPPPPAACAGV